MSTAASPLPQPNEILDPIADCLTPEVASQILAVQIQPQVQARVDELAAKAGEGTLTADERDEYEDLIERADLLGIVKSLARQVVAPAKEAPKVVGKKWKKKPSAGGAWFFWTHRYGMEED